jgi:hypothetical protein
MKLLEKGKLDLVSQQGSRGSMFESWFEKNFTQELDLKGKKSLVYNSKQITIDNHRIVILADKKIVIGVELKHIDGRLSGEPLEQLKRYGELIKDSNVEIKGIEYIFSKKSVAQLNEENIINTLGAKAKILYVGNGILITL